MSEKRFGNINNVHFNYGLPQLKINKALHYNHDESYIENKYPTIDRNSFDNRPGAYGLTASFMKFLENNKDSSDKFVIWYEDDALPGDNEELFNTQLDIAMKLIKDDKNNKNKIYYLGYADYCKNRCKNVNKWLEKTYDTRNATHCIIFTKSSIITILNYMKKNTITQAIDILLFSLHRKKIITAYDWGNNILTENPQFCGLFKQKDNHCKSRTSIINNSIR